VQKTHNSGFTLISATETALSVPATAVTAQQGQRLTQAWEMQVSAGQSVTLTKYGSYFSSRDYDAKELMWRSKDTLSTAKAAGFEELRLAQEQYLADFWQQADVQIAGDDALQQGMHFNQFHLLQ